MNLNPLRKPYDEIRETVLNVVPIGTSMEDTIKIIEENEKWEIEYISDDDRYEKPEVWFDVESKTIVTTIGKYKEIDIAFGIYDTYIIAYWDFNESLELVDVEVSYTLKTKESTFLSSLRRSNENIKKAILKLVPIGTDVEKVVEFVKDFGKYETYDYKMESLIMKTRIGYYTNFYSYAICVNWEFDLNLNLISIKVENELAG